MNIQDYFDIVAQAKKKFDGWVNTTEIRFRCLQFVFPFLETDKEITTWIFFLMDDDLEKFKKDGTVDLMKNKFKELLIMSNMPKDVVEAMKFEVDSDENVKTNFEGNYFYRLR